MLFDKEGDKDRGSGQGKKEDRKSAESSFYGRKSEWEDKRDNELSDDDNTREEPRKEEHKKNKKDKGDKKASFYNENGDGDSEEYRQSSTSFYSDGDESGNGINGNNTQKERPWLLTLKWWEYIMLLIEVSLVVYTFLVIIGVALLF